MNDRDLQRIFQEKLTDYEVNVPHDDWQAIADQLPTAVAPDAEQWQGRLHEKFENHTAPVPADSWQKLVAKLPEKESDEKILPLWIRWVGSVAVAAVACLLLALPTLRIVEKSLEHSSDFVAEVQSEKVVEMPENQQVKEGVSQNSNAAENQIERKTIQPKQKNVSSTKRTENLLAEQENSVTQNPSENVAISTEKSEILPSENAETKLIADVRKNETEQPEVAENQISIEDAQRLLEEQNQQLAANLASEVSEKEDVQEKRPIEGLNLGLLASLSPSVNEVSRFSSVSFVGSRAMVRKTKQSKDKHDLPFSIGFSVGIPLFKRLDLQTGLTYSYAHSSFVSTNRVENITTERNQQLHYVGIPLMLSYRIVDMRVIKFYVSLGGACEKGLVADQHVQKFSAENALLSDETTHEYIKGVQGSLTANVGLSIHFLKRWGLYFEPGFTWYIPSAKYPQPVNSRTVHPYNLSLTAGLRFNLK